MTESLPGFFLKTPDSNIATITSVMGGIIEGSRTRAIRSAREAFTDLFQVFAAPYTATTIFDEDRIPNITHTSHMVFEDEELFLTSAARSAGVFLTGTGFPVVVSSATADKLFFYVENVGGTYTRRIGILTTDGDLYRSDLSSTPKRIDKDGIVTTTKTYPFYEVVSGATTPTLLVGDGTVPEDDSAVADWVEEQKYGEDVGGLYFLSHLPLPLTVSITDGNGVDVPVFTQTENRISISTPPALPITIKYVRKAVFDSSTPMISTGNGLTLLEAGNIPVTNVFHSDTYRKPGQIISLEVFSTTPPNIHTTQVTHTLGGTTVFSADTVPGLEAPYTSTILSIEPGEVIGSHIITLHSASVIEGWKVNAASPSGTTHFTVSNTEVAFTGVARDAMSGDLYTIADDMLSIWEQYPMRKKEVVLQTGRALFGGTRVTAPSHAKHVYLDGELYQVTNNIVSTITGDVVSLPEREMNFAYVTDEFDLNTLMGVTGYTFDGLSIYQDSLILAALDGSSDRQMLMADLRTLEKISESDVVTMIGGTTFTSTETFDQTDYKSFDVTDYGSILILWNKNSTTVLTEHFLQYDTCHFDPVGGRYHFRFPTYSDFAFTENTTSPTVARTAMVYQAPRYLIDQRADVFTALQDPTREGMRERPHWSSGFTVLDFTNSYLMKIGNREDTSEQGLVNSVARVTGNTPYDLNPKLMRLSIPDYDAITKVAVVKGVTTTTIAQQAVGSVSGVTDSTVTASSFLTEFTTTADGWLVHAAFRNANWASTDYGLLRAILYQKIGSFYLPTDTPVVGRVLNGHVQIFPAGDAHLTTGTYALGFTSDYDNAFTVEIVNATSGMYLEGALPVMGIASTVTGATNLEYTLLQEQDNFDSDTTIVGGGLRYFPIDRGLILNHQIPDDYEIQIDYTTSRHNVDSTERWIRIAGNVPGRDRPADYVEVALV